VFLFSCSPDLEEKHVSGYRLNADNSIMALHWKMYQTMAANPGMAEQIGYRCLRLAEIWKLPRREFNARMALAELYQYYFQNDNLRAEIYLDHGKRRSAQLVSQVENCLPADFRSSSANPFPFIPWICRIKPRS
jgi:hypothetical protein